MFGESVPWIFGSSDLRVDLIFLENVLQTHTAPSLDPAVVPRPFSLVCSCLPVKLDMVLIE